jgi:tRNA (guanine37-N1)-methyltransferase
VSIRIDVFTIFPDLVDSFTTESVLGRARRDAFLDLRVHDLREFTSDVHRSVDDTTFGGGPGMVLSAQPIFDAVEAVEPPRPLVYLGPAGRPFDQATAELLAGSTGFSLLCGRYEGIDERVRTHLVDEELSLGDFVLAGGEVAALAVIEAVTRLVPGVMGNEESAAAESHGDLLLEHPHYTRPADFRGWEVPAVLRGGDHERIAEWRQAHAVLLTLRRRPDLLGRRGVSEREIAWVVAHTDATEVEVQRLQRLA